jgi:hypothetical protein
MTPLEQLRWWGRRAPIWQRVTGVSGAVALLGLLAWGLFPAGTPAGDPLAASTVGGPQAAAVGEPGETAPTAETLPEAGAPPVEAQAPTGPATAAAGAAASGAQGGCTSPPGTDSALTDREMRIGFVIVNLSGSMVNSLTNTPTPEDQRANVDAIVAAMNARGGIACRKIVVQYFEANPLDSTSLQQVCLRIGQARPFFAVDNGAFFLYPQLTACFAERQIPFHTPGLLPQSTQRTKYPYLFAGGLMEVAHRNMVLALGERGWFGAGNGFKKLGLLYRSCNATLPGALQSWVAQAGVPSGSIERYDVGCPAATAPPSAMQQAVLQFKTAGVSHVLTIEDEIDFPNFTTLAERQGFRPKYAVPSSQIGQTYATQHPDFDNISDAIAISQNRSGEERTPGMVPGGATLECDAALKAKGRQPTWTNPSGIAGNDCVALSMFKAAAEHAPVLARNALAAGLQATGTLDLSYPGGPADFRAPNTTFAGQNWRVVKYVRSCTCWHVIQREFRPSFR